RGGGPPPPVRNSLACQTKGPGPLLKRGWAPKKSGSLAGPPRGKASTRHDDRRSRARWNVDGDHKSSIWFSTTDGARELVCADVALSGNHCELNPTGRTRGSRNKLSEEVICALLRDFQQHGQKAVARGRRTQPAASNEPARGAAMTSGPSSPTVCYGALDPPVGGLSILRIYSCPL